MKKTIITCLVAFITFGASAQIAAYKQTGPQGVEGYSLPRTIIQGKVRVEREVVIRGPYAKFASQYLGITGAPMTDKESYKILGATMWWSTEPDPALVYTIDEKSGATARIFSWIEPTVQVAATMASDKDFEGAKFGSRVPFSDVGTSTTVSNSTDGLSVDRTSRIEKSTEQLAADAAAVIFKIRKSRLDLITGEVSEYVFSEGLRAALEEMSRLETEYLALFIGKRYTQITEHTFNVLPEVGKSRAVAFRFSESKGFTQPSDLSASPYNLDFAPLGAVGMTGSKKGSKVVVYRIPLVEQVTLTNGSDILASERVPIYQKGALVEAPIL